MSVTGIKMGRIPKAVREKATCSLTSSPPITTTSSSISCSNTNQSHITLDDDNNDDDDDEDNDEDNEGDGDDDDSNCSNNNNKSSTSLDKSTNKSDDFIGEFNVEIEEEEGDNDTDNDEEEEKKKKSSAPLLVGSFIQKDKDDETTQTMIVDADDAKANAHDNDNIASNSHSNKEKETTSMVLAVSKSATTVNNTNNTSTCSGLDWFSKFMNVLNSETYVDQSQLYLSKQHFDDSDNDNELPTMTLAASLLKDHDEKSKSLTSTKQFLFDILKQHKPLAKSLIQPNTYYSDLFMNLQPRDSSYQIISSMLNDKIYQLYNECYKKVHEAYERAHHLIKNKVTVFEGHDSTTKEIWSCLVESIPSFVKMVISFAKECPGLNEIDQSDFTIVINSKLFDFYIIQNASLFIDGESYQIIANNIQYTRAWMNKIKAKEKNDILFEFTQEFNRLNLTLKEKALLTTLCFTFPGKHYFYASLVCYFV